MKKYLPFAFGFAAIASGWVLIGSLYGRQPHAEPNSARQPYDSKWILKNVSDTEDAVKIDPYGALGWSMLAAADLAKSREADDGAAAVRAEQAARRSLELRKLGNVGAWDKVISALLQQHRFYDALAECVRAENAGIFSDDTILLHADCLIEVGRYDDAGVLVSKNPRAFGNASGWAVMSRLLDIGGKPQQSIELLGKATAEMDDNGGATGDTVAWFHTRLAQECLRAGRHEDARREFKISLSMYPRDYKALAGLARLCSQEGDWEGAVRWGKAADQVAQMADIRALIGDAYLMLGDRANAEAEYAAVAALVGRPSGINDGMHEVAPMAGTHGHRLDRQYAIYCADHGRDPDGAYAAALRDFQARKDIYAFDTLAWVCLQRGAKAEALQAIDRALARHTKDPMLLFHAGTIYAANGRPQEGAQFLREALQIDPQFDGIASVKARQLLAKTSSTEPASANASLRLRSQQNHEKSFHANRTFGRHCDHLDLGRNPLPGLCPGKGGGEKNDVPVEYEATRPSGRAVYV